MKRDENLAHIYYACAPLLLSTFKIITIETEEKFKLLSWYIKEKKYTNVLIFYQNMVWGCIKQEYSILFSQLVSDIQLSVAQKRKKALFISFKCASFQRFLSSFEKKFKKEIYTENNNAIFSRASKDIYWIRKQLAYDISEAYFLNEDPEAWNKLYLYCTQIQKSMEEAIYNPNNKHDTVCLKLMLNDIKKISKQKKFLENSFIHKREQQLNFSYRKLIPPMLINLLEEWLK